MVYSILSEARVRHSVAPLQPDVIQYQVVWDENRDLKGWTTFVNLDVVGAWGGFLFGTKRTESGGFIGPSNDFPAVDALVNDRIFFRMKYDQHPKSEEATSYGKIQWTTDSDPLFDEAKSITFDIINDGRWHLYEVNMGESFGWVGDVRRVRFYPCEDGHFNDEFFLGFFEIGTNSFDFSFDAEDAGSAGFSQGGRPVLGSTLIEKDVNDKLIVNLDEYGDVQITLTPQTVTAFLLTRDISLQLGKVAVGGYPRAEAFLTEDQRIRIESGTRAADSSVGVKDGPNSAAFDLGFTNESGFFIGAAGNGTDPAPNYVALSAYKPITLEIMAMFDNDDSLPAFSLAPQQYIVQAGNVHFDVVSQEIAQEIIFEGRHTGLQGQIFEQDGIFPGAGTTFIDLNHPFSDEGKVDRVFMNGSPDRNGGSKWKIFRPHLDGTLTLIDEGVIGQKDFTDDPNGGLVGSPAPDVFVAELSTSNVNTRRGDLLGIYNVGLHAGSGSALKPNALYYEIRGDAVGTFTAPSPSGAGESGLPIYAHGLQTKNRAVIDIDLQRRLNIDKLLITGEEDQVSLEYNLGVATSAVYNSDIPGSHTICYSPAPDVRLCTDRTNEGFNIQALNDGVRLAENGVAAFGDGGPSGEGGATSQGATYFYTNGDGEFYDTFEFNNQNAANYDSERDPLGIDCFFSSQTPRIDKPVGKVVMYFKDKKNQRSWQLEYSPSGGKGGNGSKPGFSIIPEDSFESVKIDSSIITNLPPTATTKDIGMDLLLSNPTRLDVIAKDGTVNPQQGVDYVQSVAELGGINFREQSAFSNMQWNRFEWKFDSIRTTAIRWYCDLHWSTKISEMEIYGVSPSDESLADNVQVFFSSDGELFGSGELLNANEKEAEFKIGNSPRFIRLIVRPTLQTAINDVKVRFEEDQVCFGEEGRIQDSIHLSDARVGSVGASTPLKISNSVGQKADLIVDIPEDIETARQLLYFNQLNEEDNIKNPQLGAPGRVDFNPDKILREESSVMLSAKAYGLINLVSGTESYRTGNISVNGGFGTGDLTGWDLTVTRSGSLDFQIPRVDDFSGYTSSSIQGGDYSFGVNIDMNQPGQDQQWARFTFKLGQTTDLSEHAASLDQGAATFEWNFRYADYGTGPAPIFKIIGGPTLSGCLADAGTILGDYGTNELSSFAGRGSTGIGNPNTGNVTFTAETLLKAGTRFVRSEITVDKTGPDLSGGNIGVQIFHMDAYSAYLNAPAVTVAKWYKSYLTGIKDFTDAQYVPVDTGLITAISGSHHWYQPAMQTTDVPPEAGQSQGYSYAFLQDRNRGIQSGAHMSTTDPGILAMTWTGEKEIGGIRIAHDDHANAFQNCTFAGHYPRFWDIQVMKTRAELGGETPNINTEAHWKVVRQVRALIREDTPAQLQTVTSSFRGSRSKINTFIFPETIATEGVRIVYLLNCDTFERDLYPAGYAGYLDFFAHTGCPDNSFNDTDFRSNKGLYSGMFTALESVGRNTLPVDNTADRELTPGVAECGGSGGIVYAACDLGRHFDIDTNYRLFELIAKTLTQTPWPSTALYSAADTDDPNQVDWDGGASYCRWLRFATSAESEYEQNAAFSDNTNTTDGKSPYQIENIPQAVLQQARIYPKIQVAGIPLEGPNHYWEDLGDILTDNRNTTFINYSDWPVIAFDLNRPYKLRKTSGTTEERRDLIAPGAFNLGSSDDINYWNTNQDIGFTYSSKAFANADSPENVEFSAWGTAVPSTAVRWVAIRGAGRLLQSDQTEQPKEYNFTTQGGTLYGVNFAPQTPEVFTENSNWFSTSRAGLVDVSTFDTTEGNPFSVIEGVDYGASHNSSAITVIGDPFYVWDGKFDEISSDDYWGVYLKDSVTNLTVPGAEFPHYIWRVFRDPYRGEPITKEIKSITIYGYDTGYYPTDFEIQTLANSEADPTLDASWSAISQSTFAGVDSYNQGYGFTFIWVNAIESYGIRVYITDSVYPDESVLNEPNELGQSNQAGIGRGPQTRLIAIQLFEEEVASSNIQGVIDTNHAWGANASSLTEVPEHGPEYLVDNNTRTFFQSTGFVDALTVTLAEPKTIDRFEWELSEDYSKQTGSGLRTSAPATFTLKANPDSIVQTILTEEDYVGITFSGTLNPPVTADTWTLEVASVQGQDEDASSIVLHEFRLIEQTLQETPLVVMDDVFDRRPGSLNQRSTRITYATDTVAVANVVLDGIDANNDEIFSERDHFVFWLWINDIALLDTSFGTIRLGNNREVSYAWRMSRLDLNSGWNELKLQFKSADDRSEIPFQPGATYDLNTGNSKVDFITPDTVITSSVDGNYTRNVIDGPGIRFFELEFRGVGSERNLEFHVDDMQFVRNKFDEVCKFTPSLYLNNSETFTIYLEGLDISIGTVEFWMQPDWDPVGNIDQHRNILPSIFKIMRPDGKFMTFFLRPGLGFVVVINDLKRVYQFQSTFSSFSFEKYETLHVALVWDINGKIGAARSTMQILINGEVIYASNMSWEGFREGGASIMFGGEVGQAVAAAPQNETASTFTPVPTQPQTNTSSAWCLLENIKIYNYAKLDFSDRFDKDLSRTQLLKPSEMLEISLDDTTWHGAGSDSLPLVVRGVESGEEGTVYIRSNIPKDITGNENRDASLLVRWKTPLVNCD